MKTIYKDFSVFNFIPKGTSDLVQYDIAKYVEGKLNHPEEWKDISFLETIETATFDEKNGIKVCDSKGVDITHTLDKLYRKQV